MPKYFVAGLNKQEHLIIEGKLEHHLTRVLRVRPGDAVLFCDGQCVDYNCVAESLNPLSLKVISSQPCYNEAACKITLYQAQLKADKMDWLIQKAVELGVYSIIPFISEHCENNKAASATKMARYQSIAEAAAGQSLRGIIPQVQIPLTWEDAVNKVKGKNKYKACGLSLVAHEKEKQQTLTTLLRKNTENEISNAENKNLNVENENANIENGTSKKEIDLFIGPEGGFSQREIDLLVAAGFHSISLGPRILRSETAALTAITQILTLVGDL